jgi:hypothetical protein
VHGDDCLAGPSLSVDLPSVRNAISYWENEVRWQQVERIIGLDPLPRSFTSVRTVEPPHRPLWATNWAKAAKSAIDAPRTRRTELLLTYLFHLALITKYEEPPLVSPPRFSALVEGPVRTSHDGGRITASTQGLGSYQRPREQALAHAFRH